VGGVKPLSSFLSPIIREWGGLGGSQAMEARVRIVFEYLQLKRRLREKFSI
jgi:hypothetical protein